MSNATLVYFRERPVGALDRDNRMKEAEKDCSLITTPPIRAKKVAHLILTKLQNDPTYGLLAKRCQTSLKTKFYFLYEL